MRPFARHRSLASCCLALALAVAIATSVATAGVQRSADPPTWTKTRPVCQRISLTTQYPSGVSGPLAGGYNAFSLVVVRKAGMGCDRARRFARRDWIDGHGPPLHFRLRRAWRSTGGSAWVGDYVGRDKGRLVEYFAVH